MPQAHQRLFIGNGTGGSFFNLAIPFRRWLDRAAFSINSTKAERIVLDACD